MTIFYIIYLLLYIQHQNYFTPWTCYYFVAVINPTLILGETT